MTLYTYKKSPENYAINSITTRKRVHGVMGIKTGNGQGLLQIPKASCLTNVYIIKCQKHLPPRNGRVLLFERRNLLNM